MWCIDPAKPGFKNPDDVSDLTPPGQSFKVTVSNVNSGHFWYLGGVVKPKPEADREVAFGRILSTVAVGNGLVYAAELDGYIHCLDAKTGKKYWEFDLKYRTWSSSFLADGKVHLGKDSGDLFVFKHGKDLKNPSQIKMDQVLKSSPCHAGGFPYSHNGISLFAIGNR